jgi:hypothetical protein
MSEYLKYVCLILRKKRASGQRFSPNEGGNTLVAGIYKHDSHFFQSVAPSKN